MFKFLIAVTVLTMYLRVEAQEVTPDVRKVVWGMSEEEVKKTEELRIAFEEEGGLGYEVKLGSLKAALLYMFVDHKLFSVSYRFIEKHTNDNLFVDDFENIQRALTRKYGFDNEDEDWVWNNDLYMDDLDRQGFAISIGHVSRLVKWTTPKTVISHKISGDNYEIDHSLTYISVEYVDDFRKSRSKSIEDDI